MIAEEVAGGLGALPGCRSARIRAATEKRRVPGPASWRKCIEGCSESSARSPDYISRLRWRNVPLWWQMDVYEGGSAMNLHTMFSATTVAKAVSSYFSRFSNLDRSWA